MVNKKAICYALLLGLICVSGVEAGRNSRGRGNSSSAWGQDSTWQDSAWERTSGKKGVSGVEAPKNKNKCTAEPKSSQSVSQDHRVGIQFQCDSRLPPTFGLQEPPIFTGEPGSMEHEALPAGAGPDLVIEPGNGDELAPSTDPKEPVSPEPQSPGQAEVDSEETVPASGHDRANGSVANGGIADQTETGSEVEDYSDMPALEPIPDALVSRGSRAPLFCDATYTIARLLSYLQSAPSGACSSGYPYIPYSPQPQKLWSGSWYIFPPNMTPDEIAKLSDEEIQAKYPKLQFWLWDSGSLCVEISHDKRLWRYTRYDVNESDCKKTLERLLEHFHRSVVQTPLLVIMDRDPVERKIPPSNSNTEVAIATKSSFPTLLGNLKKPLSEVTNLPEKSDKQSGKGGKRDNQKPSDWEVAFSFADVGQDNEENVVPENGSKNKLSEEQPLPNQTPINA